MRTTFEVMQAVKDGTEATEEELRYALHNVALWHNLMVFDLARAINENPMSDKTRRGLQRAWDNWKSGNEVPLDKRLKGSSHEPGISRQESHDRFLSKSVETGTKLFEALQSLSKVNGGAS